MFKEFIISAFITLVGRAIKEKPDSRLARFLLDEKLKNTIKDISSYYIMLEMEAESEEVSNE